MNIKEQIRAEIERQFVNTRDYRCEDWVDKREYKHGKYDAYKELLSYLDTLPEQPVEGLEKEITRTYHDGSVTDTEDINHVAYENIARHFAEWGAEHLKK